MNRFLLVVLVLGGLSLAGCETVGGGYYYNGTYNAYPRSSVRYYNDSPYYYYRSQPRDVYIYPRPHHDYRPPIVINPSHYNRPPSHSVPYHGNNQISPVPSRPQSRPPQAYHPPRSVSPPQHIAPRSAPRNVPRSSAPARPQRPSFRQR